MIVKTLDKYIVRTFLHSLLMWFIVMMTLRIVVDMFTQMDEFTESKEGVLGIASFICSYYFFNAFVYITQMGGIIIVAAAAFTMARMNHSNELTAMLASGVSLHRVVWPIILCAITMSGLIVMDQEFVIPNIKSKLIRSADSQDRKGRFQIRFFADGDRTVWWSGNYVTAEKEMQYPLVIFRDEQFNYLGHLIAEQARPGVLVGKTGREETGWLASDGELAKIASPGERVWRQNQTTDAITTTVGPGKIVDAMVVECRREKRAGKRKFVPPANRIRGARNISVKDPEFNMTILAERFVRWPVVKKQLDEQTGRVKTIYGPARLERPKFVFHTKDGQTELATILAKSATWHGGNPRESYWALDGGRIFRSSDLTPSELELRQAGRWLDYMSSSELTSLLRLKRANNPRAVRMTKYIRFAEPLNNLIMLLLGLPFILSRQRNIKASAGLCVLMVGVFYVFIYVARYMGLPDFWGAFLRVLIFGPASVLMLDSIKT
jgi:lipopolysaccharide export LptBFGC system permease protein LptF